MGTSDSFMFCKLLLCGWELKIDHDAFLEKVFYYGYFARLHLPVVAKYR